MWKTLPRVLPDPFPERRKRPTEKNIHQTNMIAFQRAQRRCHCMQFLYIHIMKCSYQIMDLDIWGCAKTSLPARKCHMEVPKPKHHQKLEKRFERIALWHILHRKIRLNSLIERRTTYNHAFSRKQHVF